MRVNNNFVLNVKTVANKLSTLLVGWLFYGVFGLSVAVADPSPLGLEMGKATIEQAKKAFKTEYKGMNKYSFGDMYSVSGAQTGIEGASDATLIFNLNGILVGVLLELPKHRFDSLYNALSQKYQVSSREIPFVGNKKVVMHDGNTEITLNAPHMSFEMSLHYLDKGFYQSYREQNAKEQQAKKQQEASQL